MEGIHYLEKKKGKKKANIVSREEKKIEVCCENEAVHGLGVFNFANS